MGLRWKSTISHTLVVVLVLISADVYLSRALRGFLVDHLGERMSREAMLAAALWQDHATDGKPGEVAHRIGTSLGMRVTLVDGEGVVVGDSEIDAAALMELENHADRPEIIAARQGRVGRSERYSVTLDRDFLYVARPIGDGRMVLRLSIPLDDVDELQAHVHRAIWLASILGLAVALVLSYGATWYESRAMAAITTAARAMASGAFRGRIHLPASAARELLELAQALQQLYAQLGERVDQATTEEARLRAIIDSVGDGILVTGSDGRVLLANESLRLIFALEPWQQGAAPVEVVRNVTVEEAIDNTLSTGAEAQLEIRASGTPERFLDVHVAPVMRDGEPRGTVTVFHDITRLRSLETVRRDFVANVSHELRTPLTAIKGCAETLAEGALDDRHAAERFVRVIGAHADRLANLLGDLLDLSRLESDQLRLRWEPFSVEDMAEAVQESLGQLAADRDVLVSLDIGPQAVAFGDAKLVEQALINLVDNAIKYTARGGRVRVSGRRRRRRDVLQWLAMRDWHSADPDPDKRRDGEGAVILVEVADTGMGIPAEEIPRVFERFYRVDPGRSRALGGTGLGLSIVRHILDAHEERVFIDSEPGRGSVFGFVLQAL